MVDSDLLTVAQTATQTATGDIKLVATLQKALDVFEDEENATYVLVLNSADASALRNNAVKEYANSEVGANALINGTFANILGVDIKYKKRPVNH